MARTVSVQDDETGITASMKVLDDDTGQRIVQLTLTAAENVGIVATDLRMLAHFGLVLPEPEPAIPAPRKPAEPGKAAAKPDRKRATPARPPAAADLLTLWRSLGGIISKCASHYGVSDQTVRNWITKARKDGTEFVLIDDARQEGAER